MENQEIDVIIECNEEIESQSPPIGVYVKVNEDGFITDVNSDIFITDFTGWQKIDEGYGDKFAHAQSHYFEMPLMSEDGVFQIEYKKN